MLEKDIERILNEEVAALCRPDLFRTPIAAFSSAHDTRYDELKEIIGPWHLSPKELLEDAQSVISYFIPYTRAVAEDPANFKERSENGLALWIDAYETFNDYVNHVNEKLMAYLSSKEFSAKAVPATHTYDPKDMRCFFSHRSAAYISNLGVFGANRLIITEKGSAGRFCTLFTSARLEVTKEPPTARCPYVDGGGCGLCIKACPVGALANDNIDRFTCNDELLRNMDKLKRAALRHADVCGKCISVCPLAYA